MISQKDSTATLLWLGGAVFTGVAITWLVVSRPWPEPAKPQPLTMSEPPPADAPEAADEDLRRGVGQPQPRTANQGGSKQAPRTKLGSPLDTPLRMAELALQAGMLLEPEGYSAWSLYQQALLDAPDSVAARDGLHAVADQLVSRTSVAMEQTRIADARRLVGAVREVLPEHEQARRLAAALALHRNGETGPAEPSRIAPRGGTAIRPKIQQGRQPKAAVEATVAQRAPQTAQPKPAPKPADPLADAASAFAATLTEGALLAPPATSAKDYLLQMIELDADDERTIAARQALTTQLLARADEAIAVADAVAADVWLTQAEQLGADRLATESARLRLDQQIIALEAARPIPVSELTVLKYVPPRYPTRAISRHLEGWVDVEFIVSKDGQPERITILEASHDRYFRKEAVNAVRQWEFEPRVLKGATVAQRTVARISFKLP